MDLPDDPVGGDRFFAGLRLRSEVPLPELPAWTGGHRLPDLIIEKGPVPEELPNAVFHRPLLQVGADGACRFAIDGVAAWWIAPDGSRIVMAMAGADQAPMRTFLFGTVFAIVLVRHGLLPLHACCLERDGQAIAISGDSGAGKSTLAAQLIGRGYRILSDDLTVVDMRSGDVPLALPTFPRIKLWQDMLDHLEIEAAGLERVRSELAKYNLPVPSAFCAEPRPIRHLLYLDNDMVEPGRTHRRLAPAESLNNIATILYRQQMVLRLGLTGWQMTQYLRLLSAVGGCTAIRRPETPAALDELLSSIPR